MKKCFFKLEIKNSKLEIKNRRGHWSFVIGKVLIMKFLILDVLKPVT